MFGGFSKAHLRLAQSQAFASYTRFLGLREDLLCGHRLGITLQDHFDSSLELAQRESPRLHMDGLGGEGILSPDFSTPEQSKLFVVATGSTSGATYKRVYLDFIFIPTRQCIQRFFQSLILQPQPSRYCPSSCHPLKRAWRVPSPSPHREAFQRPGQYIEHNLS